MFEWTPIVKKCEQGALSIRKQSRRDSSLRRPTIPQDAGWKEKIGGPTSFGMTVL
jgi:hypothetical protein